MTRARSDRGAAVIEFALVFPVIVVAVGMALYMAYVHEVRSDLQRAAQKTATYAAQQCDPIGRQASGCADDNHPNVDAMEQYAKDRFRDADFVAPDGGDPCDFDGDPQLCVRYTNDAGTVLLEPVANAHVDVKLRYRENSPFAPFLKIIGFDGLVDLEGHGEATIE